MTAGACATSSERGSLCRLRSSTGSRAPSSGSCATSCGRRSPASARLRLAALADVRPPPRRTDLLDPRAAVQARLALAQMDEEAVLKAAARAVGVAEIVDRRAARVDARLERLDHGVAQQ